MPRRVLITGGSGFLGMHLADQFVGEGVQVRLFDLEDCPRWAANKDLEYVQGDVRNPDVLAPALKLVDTVIHAAFASPLQSRKEISNVNVHGTRNICASALENGVKRIVLISSTIVLKPRRMHPFFSNSPLNRLDLYRSSRVHAERIATEFRRKGLSVAIVRPKTFVGPGLVSAFAIVFEWIQRGKPVLILGKGANHYQLLDVRDMATGIRLLEASSAEGVFYFGSRDFGTIRKDLQALLNHARSGSRLKFIPGWTSRLILRGMELTNMVPLSEWYYMSAHGKDSVFDIARAERELGWRPVRTNAQALTDTYDWYVESIAESGSIQRTRPVPLTHRILKKLAWFIQ